jgi:hypothetical protein
LDAKKMDFYRNGHNMGTAYDNFSVGDGLYPAVTLSGGNPEQSLANWHVVGIPYALKERYHRPAVLFQLWKDALCVSAPEQ